MNASLPQVQHHLINKERKNMKKNDHPAQRHEQERKRFTKTSKTS